jgi:biotin carboxylase
MTQAKVLMLGWRPESVTALRALGADVTCVLTAEEDHKRGDLLENAHVIPVHNPSDVATVLVGLERCGRSVTEFEVICTPGENPMLCAAVLASGGDWAGVLDAALLRDKDLQKRAVRAAGIAVADSRVVVRGRDLLTFPQSSGVLKPLDGTGTIGIRVWHSESWRAELAQQIDARPAGGPWLAEQWVDGPELHIDGVVRAGQLRFISIGRYVQPLLGIRDGGMVSSHALHPAAYARLYAHATGFVEQTVRALRHRDGVFHMEAFERGDELVFGEYAGRVPGADIPSMIRFQRGVDLDQEWARVLLGLEMSEIPAAAGSCFGFVSLFTPPGVLVSCPSQREVARHYGVRQVTMRARVGDVRPDPALASNVAGAFAIVEGRDGQEVVERMQQLAAWFFSASVVRQGTVSGPSVPGPPQAQPGPASTGPAPAGPAPARPRRLLVVGGASPMPSSIDIVGMALLQAASRGIHTHLTHRAEVMPQIEKAAKLASVVSVADPDCAEKTRRWAAGVRAKGEYFDMVLGLRDSVQAATAGAAELFDAPGNPPAAVRCVQNKDSCRAALAAAGFRQPSLRLCTSASEAIAFMAGSAGPWVVKPRDAAGSLGVRKVTGVNDLPQALRELPDPDLFLVEEMLSGPEYSVEGLFLGGRPRVLAVTAKYLLPPPHFVESGHVIPAELPDEQRVAIEQEVIRALTVLGLRAGVFHVELWLTADGIVLGEVHPRPAGDWVHRLMSYAIPGLEIFGLLYDDMAGTPADADLRPVRAAAIRYLAAVPGRIAAVHGWDEILEHPAVLHAELNAAPGDVVPPVRSSSDRPGFVIVGASSPAQARELAWALADSVRIVTEPVSYADAAPILGRKK